MVGCPSSGTSGFGSDVGGIATQWNSGAVKDHWKAGRFAWRRIAKICIAVLVVVGIIVATKKAVRQWQQMDAQAEEQIESLTRQAIRAERRGEDLEARHLRRAAEKVDRSRPGWRNLRYPFLLAALAAYAASLLPPGRVLERTCQALGHPCQASTAMAAQLIGHTGKYVPGKAMVVVIRAGVLRRESIPIASAATAIVVETCFMMAVGGATGTLFVLWMPIPSWIRAGAAMLAALAWVPTVPPVLVRVVRKLNRGSNDRGLDSLRWRWWTRSVWDSLLAWLGIAASFYCITLAVPAFTPLPPWWTTLPVASAAIMLAMVLGFASLLPGGAGVRELTLITILSQVTDEVHALVCAVLARLIFIAGESLMAAAAWGWLQRSGTDEPRLPREFSGSTSDR